MIKIKRSYYGYPSDNFPQLKENEEKYRWYENQPLGESFFEMEDSNFTLNLIELYGDDFWQNAIYDTNGNLSGYCFQVPNEKLIEVEYSFVG